MSAYSTYVLSLSPAAYWRLGDASPSATAVDASGNAHNGTINTPSNGNILYQQASLLPADSAASCIDLVPASNPTPVNFIDIATATPFTTTGDWTALMWLNSYDIDVFATLFSLYNPSTSAAANTWAITLQTSGVAHSTFWVQFDRYGTSGHATGQTSTLYNQSTVYLVAVEHDSGSNTCTIYVNGAAVTSFSDAVTSYAPTGFKLGIGGTTWGGYINDGVRMQEAAYWTRKLTPTEHATIYTAGTTGLSSSSSTPSTPSTQQGGGMLTLIGPDVSSMQSYTRYIDYRTQRITSVQGDENDTYECTVTDLLNQFTIAAEDEIVVLEEADPNGWPTVNLLNNPSFEGTYSSGTAPSWTTFYSGSGGSATKASSATSLYGSAAQRLTASNIDNASTFAVFQDVTLPADEKGTPLGLASTLISALPYYFSIYVKYLASAVAITPTITISWYSTTTPSGAALRTDSTALATSGASYTRYTVSAVPPTGTLSARIRVLLTATAATNSVDILVDGAQFEYATLGNYPSATFDPLLLNPDMNGAVINSVVDDWIQDGTVTGLATAVVTAPTIYSEAQQITLTNVVQSGTNRGISQNFITVNPNRTYILTMMYQVTGAMTNGVQARIGINCFDSSNNFLANFSVSAAQNEGLSSFWETLALRMGPYETNVFPANTAYVKVFIGMLSNGGANGNGQITVGACTLQADRLEQAYSALQTAIQAGIYPTPYCDATQPGCYTDTGKTGLAYRQLRRFGGFVRVSEVDYTQGQEGRLEIQAVDYGIMFSEALGNLIINPGVTDAAAISQACTYSKNQGSFLVGIDFSTFVTSQGTFNGGVYPWQNLRDIINDIAQQMAAVWWVDPYKYFHYESMLATRAPFGLADSPNYLSPPGTLANTTYPMSKFKYRSDSTQSLTQPVVEGNSSGQLSAPQSWPASGVTGNALTTTTSSDMPPGTYTSIPVQATANGTTAAGTVLQIADGNGNTVQAIVSQDTAYGSTSIPCYSFTTQVDYPSGSTVSTTGVSCYNTNPITQIDSASFGGVASVIGNANTNTYAQGYTALFDEFSGIVTPQTPPSSGDVMSVVFRFTAPILLRARSASAEAAIKRAIHYHYQINSIFTYQGAIDRANAELSKSQKPQPMGNATVTCPPAPATTFLQPMQAIPITFAARGLNSALFQIQKVVTRPLGTGGVQYDLDIGIYHPDFIIRMAQAARDLQRQGSNVTTGTVITDAQSIDESWAYADGVSSSIVTSGTWGGPSTWGGTYSWG